MLADGFGLAVQGQVELFAVLAHPADLACGYTHHEGVGGYVFVDYGACADEGVFANRSAADDGAVGAEGGTLLHQRISVFALAFDQ